MKGINRFFRPGRLVTVSANHRETGASVLAQPDTPPRPPGWKPDWQLPPGMLALVLALRLVGDRTWVLIVYDSRVGWAPALHLVPA